MPKMNRGPGGPSWRKPSTAPVYQIAPREITAVEHPMIIQNLDNGIKTFGRNRAFKRILDSVDPEECVPLYLRYNDPMCVPILSHNAPTNNVLLKITVPKRTGRKRKRGSQDPYTDTDAADLSNANPTSSAAPALHAQSKTPSDETATPETATLHSVSSRDNPTQILRKLKDNVGKYKVEAVGEIRQTHRYRGMSDFHHSTSNTEFLPKFRDTFLTGEVDLMRKFKFGPQKGWMPNEELLPPPIMSSHAVPFNWGWHQAAQVVEGFDANGKRVLTNKSKPNRGGVQYLPYNVKTVPTGPERELGDDADLHDVIANMKVALEERPIWTRRSLLNRLPGHTGLYMFKLGLPFVGYQFKGGPWRDAVIKFGIDPRTDPRYREYQTFFFQFNAEDEKLQGAPWKDSRQSYQVSKAHGELHTKDDTHVFDGKKLTLDGKIWQVCDIKVPILAKLMEDAPYREVCENESDGWYWNGTIAKFKAIMKTTLIAIKAQRPIADEEFELALSVPDVVPDRSSKLVAVPVPDLGLTKADLEEMKQKGILNDAEVGGIMRWVNNKRSYKPRQERIRPRRPDGPRRLQGPKKIWMPPSRRFTKADRAQNASQQLGSLEVPSSTDILGPIVAGGAIDHLPSVDESYREHGGSVRETIESAEQPRLEDDEEDEYGDGDGGDMILFNNDDDEDNSEDGVDDLADSDEEMQLDDYSEGEAPQNEDEIELDEDDGEDE